MPNSFETAPQLNPVIRLETPQPEFLAAVLRRPFIMSLTD